MESGVTPVRTAVGKGNECTLDQQNSAYVGHATIVMTMLSLRCLQDILDKRLAKSSSALS